MLSKHQHVVSSGPTIQLSSHQKDGELRVFISFWKGGSGVLRHHRLFWDYLPAKTWLLTHLVHVDTGEGSFTEVL